MKVICDLKIRSKIKKTLKFDTKEINLTNEVKIVIFFVWGKCLERKVELKWKFLKLKK